jgi:hypothetical protein
VSTRAWSWVFQCNPKEWDLRRCLVEQPGLFWKVSRFKKEIKIGDTVYMWESGPSAALLARCTVTSNPRLQPADPKYAEYMLDPKYLADMWRARLRVEHVLAPPIARDDLLSYPLLEEQLPIGGVPSARQGTNFSLHPAVADALDSLTQGSGHDPRR